MVIVEVLGKLELFKRYKLERRLTQDVRSLGLFLRSELSSLDVHVVESSSDRITAKVGVYGQYHDHGEHELQMLGATVLSSIRFSLDYENVPYEHINVIVSDFRSRDQYTAVIST